MKKFAMAAVAAAALSAGVAQAYTSGTFSNGFVVPNVIHNGPTDTTAVGIVNRGAVPTAVFWTFFDQDSAHVTDGCVFLTAGDYEPFVWSARAGTGVEGKRGYLVFAAHNTAATATGCPNSASPANIDGSISGNAFQVNTAASDVAFLPVIDGPLTFHPNLTDVTIQGPDSVVKVEGAAYVDPNNATPVNQEFFLRYFVDGQAGGNDTSVVIWSTGSHKKTQVVNIFDDKQNRKSVNLELVKEELDIVDPEKIVGRPGDFTDGFIHWITDGSTLKADPVPAGSAAAHTPPAAIAANAGSIYAYSVISSPAFGAVQTVLGAHNQR
ncbi:MAG: hypothetical protein LBP52_03590 [Burkholderiaceae bacterium]|jgi:hypothetical protein|nr:hypothetical protein [Burkholderiaceae bacterium]